MSELSAESLFGDGYKAPSDFRVALIRARFNAPIVSQLVQGCTARLCELGVADERVEQFAVPGAYELPLACAWAAASKRFSAVIAIGAVVRGDTPHFEYVAGEASAGCMRAQLDSKVPVVFGVLTTDNDEQAEARAAISRGNKGKEFAEAALEMFLLAKELRF